jgi:hypothetical protein
LTTRFSSILFISFALFYLPAAQGRANEASRPDGALEFFSAAPSGVPPFVDGERPGASQPNKSLVLVNLGRNSLTVKTQLVEKPAEGWSGLATQDQGQGKLSTVATSSIFGRLLIAEGEWAYNSSDVKSLGGLGQGPNRLLRLGAKGAWAEYMYGAEYRSVGKDFVNLGGPAFAGDQEGGELWVQRKLGLFTVKTSVSDFTNNVAADPNVLDVTKLQGGANLSYARPSWPVLSLFYSKGSQWSSNEPDGFQPQTGTFDSLGTALQYKAAQWDTTLSSTFSFDDITTRPDRRFRLAPARAQTHTPALSLGLNYRPSILPVQVSAFGSYTKTEASDGHTDNDVFNLSAALVWSLGETPAGKNTLSLGTTVNNHLDNVNPEASSENVSVWVRLKVAAF